MKKIKFKVENIESNELIAIEEVIDGNWITWYNEGELCLERKEFEGIVKSSLKLRRRQYTGLKDKNGNEIYVGDILHLQNHRTDIIVKESYYGFGFCEVNEQRDGTFLPSYWEDSEIIGNVFSNHVKT